VSYARQAQRVFTRPLRRSDELNLRLIGDMGIDLSGGSEANRLLLARRASISKPERAVLDEEQRI